MKANKHLRYLGICGAAALALAQPAGARAAVATVSVLDDYFSPSTTSIHAGDSVVWTWGSDNDPHNVVSDATPFAWLFPSPDGGPGTIFDQDSSNTENSPYSFTNTFTTTGSFPYECVLHEEEGMAGVIKVAASPPSLAITNPVAGEIFSAPASVTIQAAASDSGGKISKVQFLVDSIVLSNCLTAPFLAVTNNLPTGSHTLTAIASDTNGLTATKSITISVVAPNPITNSAVGFATGASFHFSYSTTAGLGYLVQVSTNLLNWTSVNTNIATTNTAAFTDTNAANVTSFYRVQLKPNP
jgi:plastocyanin